jgi:regulator of replication initiation timing
MDADALRRASKALIEAQGEQFRRAEKAEADVAHLRTALGEYVDENRRLIFENARLKRDVNKVTTERDSLAAANVRLSTQIKPLEDELAEVTMELRAERRKC